MMSAVKGSLHLREVQAYGMMIPPRRSYPLEDFAHADALLAERPSHAERIVRDVAKHSKALLNIYA
jgi:hypothetical protein